MGKELKAGDKSPDFSLTSDKGDKVDLKQFRGNEWFSLLSKGQHTGLHA